MSGNTRLIEIRPLKEEEIGHAYTLEKEGYPEDEAAGFDILMYRHREAPELTVGFFCNDDLLAFVSASRYHGDTLEKEAMSMHIPKGETVCIHSVCVSGNHRRQGIATRLLKHFTETIRLYQTDVVRILLITKSYLIPFYTRAGFVFRAKSTIKHGKDQWYEFEMDM